MEVPHLVTPEQVADVDPLETLGIPGEYPYTRGIHPDRLSRQALDDAPVRRLRHRRGHQPALQVPALPGPDRPLDRLPPADALRLRLGSSRCRTGEVGKCGVAVDTLADMETLFDGIHLGEVTDSMTINSTAPILFAMYLAVAEKQGADSEAGLAARCRTTSSRSTSRRRSTSSRRGPRCG